MRAMDVMTTPVITVDPETTVQDLAKLLSDRNVSGVSGSTVITGVVITSMARIISLHPFF